MSRHEHIFFDSGHRDLERAATDVAVAVAGRYLEQFGVDRSIKTVGVSMPLDDIEMGAYINGAIEHNDVGAMSDPQDPTDWEIHDSLPLVWTMTTGPHREETFARRGAQLAFQRLVDSGVGWPMVLAHDVSELVATYDVEHGVREFPPGTSTFATEHR